MRWAALVAGVIVMATGGCSSSPRSATLDKSAFHPNIRTFTLPLDTYLTDSSDARYAQSIVYAHCMARRGYQVPVDNPDDFRAPANSHDFAVEFNLALAAHYGYHTGPVRGGHTAPKRVLSGAELVADGACAKQAQRAVAVDDDLENSVRELAFGADDATTHDPGYRAAVARWRNCMLPLGLPDLPADPNEMPSPSQHRRFFTGGDVPTSPDEIKQAVFDARCRQSSGYAVTYYRTEIKYQWAEMAKHTVLLAQALAAKNRATANIRRILRAHGD